MKAVSRSWKAELGEEPDALSRIELSDAAADALTHDRDGWWFVAIAMLIINAIWLVFGVLGYGLAWIIFR
jgi:hypothetical protein